MESAFATARATLQQPQSRAVRTGGTWQIRSAMGSPANLEVERRPLDQDRNQAAEFGALDIGGAWRARSEGDLGEVVARGADETRNRGERRSRDLGVERSGSETYGSDIEGLPGAGNGQQTLAQQARKGPRVRGSSLGGWRIPEALRDRETRSHLLFSGCLWGGRLPARPPEPVSLP